MDPPREPSGIRSRLECAAGGRRGGAGAAIARRSAKERSVFLRIKSLPSAPPAILLNLTPATVAARPCAALVVIALPELPTAFGLSKCNWDLDFCPAPKGRTRTGAASGRFPSPAVNGRFCWSLSPFEV
jgi:hypothetical protein